MDNKISGLIQPGVQNAAAVGSKNTSTSGKQATARPQQDSLALTDAARHLQQLAKQQSLLPAIDSSRVQKIQQAIASGAYQVDSQKIAKGLISAEQQLSTSGRS